MKKQGTSMFLPTSKKEMDALGWEQADVILFTGDAYVDHPAFGAAVIGRILEREGFKVAIVPQPNWRDDLRDFRKLGTPRLFFAVTSGNMDSMINHYTANKRLRSDDAYTAGGEAGNRPDYATKVYSQIIKKMFPEVPLVIGGIEASLRRFTHYDYWSNSLLPGILTQTQADLLIYGMGEKPIVELAKRVAGGESIQSIVNLPQTAFITSNKDLYLTDSNSIVLHSFEKCLKDKLLFGENFKVIEEESNKQKSTVLVEEAEGLLTVVNPPYAPATETEMDSWFSLPFTRLPHPRYGNKIVPAWEMIKFSVNIHRGCFGGCSFCTISAHQGKFVVSRSEDSVMEEIEKVTQMPDFKGYLSDVGGPSANMYGMRGIDERICAKCKRPSCIHPEICKNLNTSHSRIVGLFQRIRTLKAIKKAFVGSGIRYDLFINKTDSVSQQYFSDLVRFHVSGRLKVAPEHTEDHVLMEMRKPNFEMFKKLKQNFDNINQKYTLNQQLIPYFISSHPGCTLKDMENLATETQKMRINLEQVQDFTPTPMTLASTIFYTGVNPYTSKKVFVARGKDEKLKQRSHFFGATNKPTTKPKYFKRK